MVIFTISVTARANKHSELLSTCRLIVDQTRSEKGCTDCRLSQDLEDQNIINLEATWEQRTTLDDYFRSDMFGALLGAAKLLGKAHAIRINDGSICDGIEAVRLARSQPDTTTR